MSRASVYEEFASQCPSPCPMVATLCGTRVHWIYCQKGKMVWWCTQSEALARQLVCRKPPRRGRDLDHHHLPASVSSARKSSMSLSNDPRTTESLLMPLGISFDEQLLEQGDKQGLTPAIQRAHRRLHVDWVIRQMTVGRAT